MLPLQPSVRLLSYMCAVSHECTGVHVCVCARANACMHVDMQACMQCSGRMFVCMHTRMHRPCMRVYIHASVCAHVGVRVRMPGCLSTCLTTQYDPRIYKCNGWIC